MISMKEGAILERTSDGVYFRVVELGHWSTITNDDGESDKVKCFGDSSYVSASKGFTYLLIG